MGFVYTSYGINFAIKLFVILHLVSVVTNKKTNENPRRSISINFSVFGVLVVKKIMPQRHQVTKNHKSKFIYLPVIPNKIFSVFGVLVVKKNNAMKARKHNLPDCIITEISFSIN